MKIGQGVSELRRVENRPPLLTWPMAYTTACTTVQAVIGLCSGLLYLLNASSAAADFGAAVNNR